MTTKVQHPVDRLQTITRGIKATRRSIKDPQAALEIDRAVQDVQQLILEAQVRTLLATDDMCEDLLDHAERQRDKVRSKAAEVRLTQVSKG